MIVGWAVQSKLKSKFKKYSATPLSSGLSGKEVAEKMLADHGITKVRVINTPGKLTDHYNPQGTHHQFKPRSLLGKKHLCCCSCLLTNVAMPFNMPQPTNGWKCALKWYL
jgi:hypothetical protein